MLKRFLGVLLLLTMLVGCTAGDRGVAVGSGPQLLGEEILSPSAVLPTRFLSPTPTREGDDLISPTPFVSEPQSPLEIVTIEADFVIVTPTLPPSKTPTHTPTDTLTPSVTPSPTLTVTATSTAPFFPTSVIIPITAVVVNPVDEVCNTAWQYIQPPPQGCPFFPATVGIGVYQEFERGIMIWDGSSLPGQIYVLFNDGATPYWTRFNDTFVEGQGMFPFAPWKDPGIDAEAPGGLWQPVRGFGRLWRNEDNDPVKATVRPRVGWATQEFEKTYSIYTQTRQDGTLFITVYDNGFPFRAFQLNPGGFWVPYAG